MLFDNAVRHSSMTQLMCAMCRSSGEEDARVLTEAARFAAAPFRQDGGAGGVELCLTQSHDQACLPCAGPAVKKMREDSKKQLDLQQLLFSKMEVQEEFVLGQQLQTALQSCSAELEKASITMREAMALLDFEKSETVPAKSLLYKIDKYDKVSARHRIASRRQSNACMVVTFVYYPVLHYLKCNGMFSHCMQQACIMLIKILQIHQPMISAPLPNPFLPPLPACVSNRISLTSAASVL